MVRRSALSRPFRRRSVGDSIDRLDTFEAHKFDSLNVLLPIFQSIFC